MKVLCTDCKWVGEAEEVLHAQSPFDGSQIDGCPKCFGIDTVTAACAHEGCTETPTCGAQVKGEYVFTCSRHLIM